MFPLCPPSLEPGQPWMGWGDCGGIELGQLLLPLGFLWVCVPILLIQGTSEHSLRLDALPGDGICLWNRVQSRQTSLGRV